MFSLYQPPRSSVNTKFSLFLSFQGFGEIVDAEIIFNERGSKGFGFITFMTAEDANVARDAISGKTIDGRRVEVSDFYLCTHFSQEIYIIATIWEVVWILLTMVG